MTFCIPNFPRAGLGNRLFPWARCKLFARRAGARMLTPAWAQLKIGPLLRREADSRLYIGLFQPAPEEVTGLRRLVTLASRPRVGEPPAGVRQDLPDGVIVEFAELRGFFESLNGEAAFIRCELAKSVRPRWLSAAFAPPSAPIGLHVRRGDFATPKSPEELKTSGNLRTPIDWFVDSLSFIRNRWAIPEVPAVVVSDGSPDDLAGLLALPGVRLIRTGSAISDLLFLGRSRIIIGSGGSSFSAWSSYLGETPLVTVAGQSPAWYRLHHPSGAFVGEFDPAQPNAEWVEQLDRLRPSPASALTPLDAMFASARTGALN